MRLLIVTATGSQAMDLGCRGSQRQHELNRDVYFWWNGLGLEQLLCRTYGVVIIHPMALAQCQREMIKGQMPYSTVLEL